MPAGLRKARSLLELGVLSSRALGESSLLQFAVVLGIGIRRVAFAAFTLAVLVLVT